MTETAPDDTGVLTVLEPATGRLGLHVTGDMTHNVRAGRHHLVVLQRADDEPRYRLHLRRTDDWTHAQVLPLAEDGWVSGLALGPGRRLCLTTQDPDRLIAIDLDAGHTTQLSDSRAVWAARWLLVDRRHLVRGFWGLVLIAATWHATTPAL